MRAIFIFAGAALLAAGCRQATTTQAGGRPVEHWLQELKNPDAKARKHAVAKLGNVGPADAAVLPGLRAALADTDDAVRGEAILALMKFGPSAKEVAPALEELAKNDRSAQVRDYAAKALEKLQADAGVK